jgi:hypothetical protein
MSYILARKHVIHRTRIEWKIRDFNRKSINTSNPPSLCCTHLSLMWRDQRVEISTRCWEGNEVGRLKDPRNWRWLGRRTECPLDLFEGHWFIVECPLTGGGSYSGVTIVSLSRPISLLRYRAHTQDMKLGRIYPRKWRVSSRRHQFQVFTKWFCLLNSAPSASSTEHFFLPRPPSLSAVL